MLFTVFVENTELLVIRKSIEKFWNNDLTGTILTIQFVLFLLGIIINNKLKIRLYMVLVFLSYLASSIYYMTIYIPKSGHFNNL